MAYLDIIPLAQAKIYLKVDDTLTEDDANITRMIKASLMQLERKTNVILFARSKEYLFDECQVLIYDFPVNELTSPTTAIRNEKTQYSIYTAINTTDLKLVLNVGYEDVLEVPTDLIEVAYEMLDIMYYAKESKLSMLSQIAVETHKRFIL
jgi:hypothetical protein